MASFFLVSGISSSFTKQIFFFLLYIHCWTLFTVTLPLFETHMKNYRLSLCLSGCRPQWLHAYASISMDWGAQKTKQNNHDNMNAKISRSVWRPDGGTQRNRKERFNRQEKTWDQVRLDRLLIFGHRTFSVHQLDLFPLVLPFLLEIFCTLTLKRCVKVTLLWSTSRISWTSDACRCKFICPQ